MHSFVEKIGRYHCQPFLIWFVVSRLNHVVYVNTLWCSCIKYIRVLYNYCLCAPRLQIVPLRLRLRPRISHKEMETYDVPDAISVCNENHISGEFTWYEYSLMRSQCLLTTIHRMVYMFHFSNHSSLNSICEDNFRLSYKHAVCHQICFTIVLVIVILMCSQQALLRELSL